MKNNISIYFISWDVFDAYKSYFIDAEHRKQLTKTYLSFWSTLIVEGNDRKIVKDRTRSLIDTSLTKNELATLIKGFKGLVIVK